MPFDQFGGIQIYSPPTHLRDSIQALAGKELRTKYAPGIYTDGPQINAIIRSEYAFYKSGIDANLPQVASGEFLVFLLAEYDKTCQINSAAKSGAISPSEEDRWQLIGPNHRRSLKHLAELVVMMEPPSKSPCEESAYKTYFNEILCCMLAMVELAELSNQTVRLFPTETTLTLYPLGRVPAIFLEVGNTGFEKYRDRVLRDTANRARFLGDLSFLGDSRKHDKYLGDSIREMTGLGYRQCIEIVRAFDDIYTPLPLDESVVLCRKVEAIQKLAKVQGESEQAVAAAMNGFLLTSENMKREGRVLWSPKQNFRTYRRGVFEIQLDGEPFLAWSREFFKECFGVFITDACFQKLPDEWCSDDTDAALSNLSRATGDWFEEKVCANLVEWGFVNPRAYKKTIQVGLQRLDIPTRVGEIDVLTYYPRERLLLVGECKATDIGTESVAFSNERLAFLKTDKGFLAKFKRKADWLYENRDRVWEILSRQKQLQGCPAPTRFAWLFLTYYPCAAAHFSDECPFVSITEFLMDWQKGNTYPYAVGVRPWRE